MSEIELACRSVTSPGRGRVHRVRMANGPVAPACRPVMAGDRRYVITGEAVTCPECLGAS